MKGKLLLRAQGSTLIICVLSDTELREFQKAYETRKEHLHETKDRGNQREELELDTKCQGRRRVLQ